MKPTELNITTTKSNFNDDYLVKIGIQGIGTITKMTLKVSTKGKNYLRIGNVKQDKNGDWKNDAHFFPYKEVLAYVIETAVEQKNILIKEQQQPNVVNETTLNETTITKSENDIEREDLKELFEDMTFFNE